MNKKYIQKEKLLKIQIENIIYKNLYDLKNNIITIKNLKILKNINQIDVYVSSLFNNDETILILNKISNKIKNIIIKTIKNFKINKINFIKYNK